jgi:phosphatidate cytidylyltransferase
MNNFWQRALTGAVFVGVMVGGIYMQLTFWLFLLIAGLGLWEFYRIMLGEGNTTTKVYGTVIGLLVYVSLSLVFNGGPHVLPFTISGRPDSLALLLPGFLLILLIELFRKHPDPIKNISIAVFGWLYVAMPFALGYIMDAQRETAYLPPLRTLPFLVVVFILIWCNDTFAYLTGRLIGRTPLFPRISPKKTIEGTLGGAVVTMVAAWLLQGYLLYPLNASVVFILLTGLTVAVMGVLGDLVESKFKRQLNIKDSGNILPGHGGILDRFDSFLVVVPSVYLLLQVAYHFIVR